MPQRPEKENMPDFQRRHSRGSGIRDSQIHTHGLTKAFQANTDTQTHFCLNCKDLLFYETAYLLITKISCFIYMYTFELNKVCLCFVCIQGYLHGINILRK